MFKNSSFRRVVGTKVIVQGNLDPCALYAPPVSVSFYFIKVFFIVIRSKIDYVFLLQIKSSETEFDEMINLKNYSYQSWS